jgi:predicted ATPase/class 3 adenylate cyclase
MAEEVVPPSGTVTFLFTDVVGSTRLWENHPDLMRSALLDHDHILRSVIETHGGYVFSTAGDAFAAAFARTADAVAAARATQDELQRHLWPGDTAISVRIGLHTGEAEERDGDYFGQALNRCARLMSAAHGGQVVLSDVTASLLGPDGLRELGPHRLKDLGSPEIVWQLGDEEFPSLRGASRAESNLPVPLTSFVGRAETVDRVVASLDDHRLVSIVGPGGMGKTRVAIEAAARLFDAGSEVWFVDLRPLADDSDIAQAVGETIGLLRRHGDSWAGTVLEALAVRELVIILDNCEHVAVSAASLVARLLQRAVGVRVVATGRQALSVPGELVTTLGGLDEAVALFVERAKLVDPDFEPDGTIPDLCGRLDGMPLAIELAAARVRLMRPAELLDRIDQRFRMLRSADPHAATLASTLEWSIGQLDPRTRATFHVLAVFAGSFDHEAATAVVDQDADEFDVLDDLQQLVDLSLVVPVAGSRRPRFRLLETMKTYGRGVLDADDLELAHRRHARHYERRVTALLPLLDGDRPNDYLGAVAAEHGEIRAALDWALAAEPEMAASLATSTAPFWYWRSHYSDGVKYLSAVRDLDHPRRDDAHTFEIMCRHSAGEFDDILAALDDLLEEQPQHVLRGLRAQLLVFADRIEEAFADARTFGELPHPLETHLAPLLAGAVMSIMSRYGDRGVEVQRRVAPAYRSHGRLAEIGLMYGDVFIALAARAPDALERFQATATAFNEIGMRYLEGQMHHWSGILTERRGDEDWLDHFERGVRMMLEIGAKRMPVTALYHLADRARLESVETVVLLGAAHHLRAGLGEVLPAVPSDDSLTRQVARLREAMGDDPFEEAWATGMTMTLDEASDFGLAAARRAAHP